jgi:hypothetical protein
VDVSQLVPGRVVLSVFGRSPRVMAEIEKELTDLPTRT